MSNVIDFIFIVKKSFYFAARARPLRSFTRSTTLAVLAEQLFE